MSRYKSLGIESFYNKEFSRALYYFSLALREDPHDKEARICAILADLATEREEEAISLFDYYTMHENSSEESDAILEEIIDSLEVGPEKLLAMFENQALETQMQEEDGIVYEDFVELVEKKGNFKEAFENIMFSTKVLIANKEDFIDFLDNLIEYGYIEMSFRYLESAVSIYPNEIKFHSLLKKAQGSSSS
ncbi:MAG: tetratricopeptide repeat protein [Campylobacteraceae bacterium]|nr:tetratricopeptide repeat protein [Campylobacteraceae bacterium]